MTYILYNPLANGGHYLPGIQKVQETLRGQQTEIKNVLELETRPFLLGLTEADQVILCGGDGTINCLINDLDGEVPAVPVYVWKFGTGNDFLRDVPVEPGAQMVLLNDYIRNLPCAEIGGRRIRFINNCSYGLDGIICETGERVKGQKKSKVNYTWLAIRSIVHDYHCANARVTVDGQTREYEKVWLASAFNGRFVGGGMKLAPGQERLSDTLCCLVWHGTGRFTTILHLISVFWGGHVKRTDICDVRFGRDIQVEFDRPAPAQLDGEVVSGVTGYSAHK